MSQNITLMGASYTAVPAVTLPKTGGGTARFDDATVTTATASDVASGKVFLASDGTITTGTNSGGGGGGSVTQDQDGFIVLPETGGGGGGASNYVHGEFHTNSSASVQAVTIPYTGSGYPIMAYVVVKGGANASGTDWYDTIKRYAVAFWTMTKANMASSPTYTTSGEENAGVVSYSYKNSDSSSTLYAIAGGMNINVFSSDNPTNNASYACRFKSATSMYVKVEGSSTGLLVDTDYEYFIVYSS